MSNSAIAYWLLPAELAREFFTEIIATLAARFDAPRFHPHVTLFVAPDDSSNPAKVLSRIGRVEISLHVISIDWSEQFTKTLFVQFEQSDVLKKLAETIRVRTNGERSVIDPHLSLLYKRLPKQAKRNLAGSIRLPFQEVAFDSICAMRCVSPTRNAADVRAWKLVASQNSNTR